MYKYNANVIVDQIKFEQKNKDIITAHGALGEKGHMTYLTIESKFRRV